MHMPARSVPCLTSSRGADCGLAAFMTGNASCCRAGMLAIAWTASALHTIQALYGASHVNPRYLLVLSA
jgi:hypothetical protein